MSSGGRRASRRGVDVRVLRRRDRLRRRGRTTRGAGVTDPGHGQQPTADTGTGASYGGGVVDAYIRKKPYSGWTHDNRADFIRQTTFPRNSPRHHDAIPELRVGALLQYQSSFLTPPNSSNTAGALHCTLETTPELRGGLFHDRNHPGTPRISYIEHPIFGIVGGPLGGWGGSWAGWPRWGVGGVVCWGPDRCEWWGVGWLGGVGVLVGCGGVGCWAGLGWVLGRWAALGGLGVAGRAGLGCGRCSASVMYWYSASWTAMCSTDSTAEDACCEDPSWGKLPVRGAKIPGRRHRETYWQCRNCGAESE
jgi:hypothetical protein